jgi:hypothetical protein
LWEVLLGDCVALRLEPYGIHRAFPALAMTVRGDCFALFKFVNIFGLLKGVHVLAMTVRGGVHLPGYPHF